MIIGKSESFAIESKITNAYDNLGLRALGYFVIYVGGRRYGVHSPDATMLANSFDEVGRRMANRGRHTAPFADQPNGGEIADAVRSALYGDTADEAQFFGISRPEFRDIVYANHLLWAPDGDAAFDDRSYILQMDVKDRVRLIAFKSADRGFACDPDTLRDIWLPGDEYYRVLGEWHHSFEAQWASKAKLPA